jgi:hypothetical protein
VRHGHDTGAMSEMPNKRLDLTVERPAKDVERSPAGQSRCSTVTRSNRGADTDTGTRSEEATSS